MNGQPTTLYSVHINPDGTSYSLWQDRVVEDAEDFKIETADDFAHFCNKNEVHGYYWSSAYLSAGWRYNVQTWESIYADEGLETDNYQCQYFREDLTALRVTIERLTKERDALQEQSCRRSQQLDSVRQIKTERTIVQALSKHV